MPALPAQRIAVASHSAVAAVAGFRFVGKEGTPVDRGGALQVEDGAPECGAAAAATSPVATVGVLTRMPDGARCSVRCLGQVIRKDAIRELDRAAIVVSRAGLGADDVL